MQKQILSTRGLYSEDTADWWEYAHAEDTVDWNRPIYSPITPSTYE